MLRCYTIFIAATAWIVISNQIYFIHWKQVIARSAFLQFLHFLLVKIRNVYYVLRHLLHPYRKALQLTDYVACVNDRFLTHHPIFRMYLALFLLQNARLNHDWVMSQIMRHVIPLLYHFNLNLSGWKWIKFHQS